MINKWLLKEKLNMHIINIRKQITNLWIRVRIAGFSITIIYLSRLTCQHWSPSDIEASTARNHCPNSIRAITYILLSATACGGIGDRSAAAAGDARSPSGGRRAAAASRRHEPDVRMRRPRGRRGERWSSSEWYSERNERSLSWGQVV